MGPLDGDNVWVKFKLVCQKILYFGTAVLLERFWDTPENKIVSYLTRLIINRLLCQQVYPVFVYLSCVVCFRKDSFCFVKSLISHRKTWRYRNICSSFASAFNALNCSNDRAGGKEKSMSVLLLLVSANEPADPFDILCHLVGCFTASPLLPK